LNYITAASSKSLSAGSVVVENTVLAVDTDYPYWLGMIID
jgi:hypothetical protein